MRRPLIAVVLAGTLLAGGCGIPDNTVVRPINPDPVGGEVNTTPQAPGRVLRSDTTNIKEFATNFLLAAAGDQGTAADRVKQFLSPDVAATFRPQPDGIKVIRLVGEPQNNPDDPNVTIPYREVGMLRAKGVLEPTTNPETEQLKLEIGEVNGLDGLYVRKPVTYVFLDVDALDNYYQKQTIYFWNQEHSGLVPDTRYLPRDLPATQRPNQIIDWLTSGPQGWLGSVVEPLPEGTKAIGNVPAISNSTLQINLSGQVLPEKDSAGALQRLQQQLRWSMRPLPNTLALSIEHEDHTYTGDDYLPANPAYQTEGPERFAIYNKQIVRLAHSERPGQAVPIVRPQDNKNVLSAALAMSGSRSYAALVVDEGNRKQSLKVGAAGAGEAVTLTRKRLPAGADVGHPVWAVSPIGADPGTNGLITMNGGLYSFPAEGFGSADAGLTAVQWPGGAPGAITAVAVAPDSHRVALVAGGALYLSGLSFGDGGLQLTSPHVIRTELQDLTAVTWSNEESLALAGLERGTDRRYATMEVSIDGAFQSYRQDSLSSIPVTNMTSRPASPTRDDSGAVAYLIGDAAYDEQKAQKMTVGDLAVKVDNPTKGIVPTAPFFLS
ncbi:LpqB family beta-propeller domain-containing protein [Actinoplanes sp. NPDC051470]|uniref:LpqB family beta-propeller domain-containing protein n=1 Tax=unclassified Actinoplanes TaxID=2626549 RepID=UPI003418B532